MQRGQLHATVSVTNPPEQRVAASLRDGLESEIQFNVRVYEHSGGLFSFLGDKLVGEWKSVHRARWDEFGNDYLVTDPRGTSRRSRSLKSFLASFFHLSNAATGIRLSPGKHYYILSNVQIQIVRLVPPLTMIAVFLPNRQIDTPWVETEINVK